MMDIKIGKPTNYESLKRDANSKSDWRKRLAAVEELGNWKCRESIDILWHRMMSDKVYKVQEVSFRKLQAFGEKVKLPRKKKGNLFKDIRSKLSKVKHSLPDGHKFENFKNEFGKRYPVEYDTYEGDKESRFDKWLENVWRALPAKK